MSAPMSALLSVLPVVLPLMLAIVLLPQRSLDGLVALVARQPLLALERVGGVGRGMGGVLD